MYKQLYGQTGLHIVQGLREEEEVRAQSSSRRCKSEGPCPNAPCLLVQRAPLLSHREGKQHASKPVKVAGCESGSHDVRTPHHCCRQAQRPGQHRRLQSSHGAAVGRGCRQGLAPCTGTVQGGTNNRH